MTYLLDTNVLSEVRRKSGDGSVKTWLAAQDPLSCAISAITVMEIEMGIAQVSKSDPAQASHLLEWLETKVLTGFAGRILPVDLHAVRAVAPRRIPEPVPERDALIAGTALSRGLIVVTRNVRDFQRVGVEVLNPWSKSPG